MHQHYRDNHADADGLVVPNEDSESEDSSTDFDGARTSLVQTTTSYSPKKDSFVQRL